MVFFELAFSLRMCTFQRIARKVMEFDFFCHGKSWDLNCEKEYEPCIRNANYVKVHDLSISVSNQCPGPDRSTVSRSPELLLPWPLSYWQ